MNSLLLRSRVSRLPPVSLFKFHSSTSSEQHKKRHSKYLFNPEIYKNTFVPTNIQEIDFIRQPFYNMAKMERMSADQAKELLQKIEMQVEAMGLAQSAFSEGPNPKPYPYSRYADDLVDKGDKKSERLFRFPRNKPYEPINAGELFRIAKPEDHMERLKIEKSFLAEWFFPPFELKESNLRHLFQEVDRQILEDPVSRIEEYNEWKEQLIQVINKLNHDHLPTLALHLAYEVQLNDPEIWRCLEDQVIAHINLFSISQLSQLEFATTELKPKYFRARANTLMMARVIQELPQASAEEMMCALQGFRNKRNKEICSRVREAMIERKGELFPQKEEGERTQRIIDFLFCLASNKPQYYGVYQVPHMNDLVEMLSHYEEELKQGIMLLEDGEHLSRIAQALYLLKVEDFESLWHRIDLKTQELGEKLTKEQTVNIARSLSRALNNRMWGDEKTFVALEKNILKYMAEMSDRDVSHVMYAFSVRKSGNPELYRAFDARLSEMAGRLDYPSLNNALYYLMFTDNADRKVWEQIVNATVSNQDILPIIFYRAFKSSEYFLNHHFPDMDLRDYTDKFFYPERYYNVIAEELNYPKDNRYIDFKTFLTAVCFVFPIPFVSIDNLFLLHYIFFEQKIAINFHLENKLIYGRTQPTELQKLASKLLKFQGWEIWDLSELEFNDWTFEERVNNVKGWLKEAKQRQIDKGLIPAEPPHYV